ncbi:hypothetical protein BDW42DRAFT_166917 [Aspergillus taichungensis]|uniref:Uncharacterized protein n=1 Tax=Aspergillus taichungensis TaxID=482145 RepID=A0A2J5HXR4_9EURO|nr:hypothetical protein BDW42DRAFT_166917 [Aspergillus taichungensis]
MEDWHGVRMTFLYTLHVVPDSMINQTLSRPRSREALEPRHREVAESAGGAELVPGLSPASWRSWVSFELHSLHEICLLLCTVVALVSLFCRNMTC